jgi:hypothetical protein
VCPREVGPSHRAQISEELLQLSIIEHAVLGEILRRTHRNRTPEELINRGDRTPPAGVFSIVSGHNVTSMLDCRIPSIPRKRTRRD